MIVTVQIAIWGTALAVVFGIPFSIPAPPTSARHGSCSLCAG
jgi:ABC-type phosphate/phosphonate transport system permease subunit